MRMNRTTMSLLCALSAVVACSDSSDGVNDSTESLKRGALADGGSVQGRDHDRDADEEAEEALTDGGHRRGRDDDDARDGGHHRGGRVRGFLGDAGCQGRGHDEERDDDRGDRRGDDRGPGQGGKGHGGKDGGWAFDAGSAP